MKKIIIDYDCSSREIIIKICEKTSTKLAKYYAKTKEFDKLLYNLTNILNFTQKLSLYKMWDNKNDKNSVNYETKYQTKFKIYFRRYYNLAAILRAKAQRANLVEEIIQYNNAINLLLTFLQFDAIVVKFLLRQS